MYRISSNNSQAYYWREGDYFKYCSLKVVPYIRCFIFPFREKIITSNKLNMGILSVPNLVPWLIFRALILTDQFCWITLHLNLTGRGLIQGRLLFEEIYYNMKKKGVKGIFSSWQVFFFNLGVQVLEFGPSLHCNFYQPFGQKLLLPSILRYNDSAT